MREFFDLNEGGELLHPMYGTVHLITIAAMVIFILLMIWQKDAVKKLANNRRFVVGFLIAYIAIDIVFWSVKWIYLTQPLSERFPLHLCGSLSILMPILILTKKYDWFRFFSYWAVCAGFISFANQDFGSDEVWSFSFIHYMVRHYFLFLFPFFIQIGREFTHSYKKFLYSCAALAGWALLIFFLDWGSGANYMHMGQHGHLEIPFLPKSFTAWPWVYPSFVGVGFILMHFAFLGLRAFEKNK